MTPSRIREWTMRVTDILSKESTEDAVRALIAEVRREVLDEAWRAAVGCRTVPQAIAAIRQLAEREGER
jgi:hypothetical protein